MRNVLLILLILLTGCSTGGIGAGEKKPISEELKLKADKSKIYKAEKIEEVICPNKIDCYNTGREIMRYTYLSPVKDKKKTFTGKIKIKNDKDGLLGATEEYKEVDVKLDEIDRDYNRVTYGYYEEEDKNFKVTETFSGVQYVKELATGDWFTLETPATTTVEAWEEQMETATSTLSYFKGLTLSLIGINSTNAATSTFYPDANAETNTVDGRTDMYYTAGTNSDTWADIIGGAGLRAFDDQTIIYHFSVVCDTATDKFRMNTRSVYLFDTSSIGTDTIDSAVFSLYGNAVYNELPWANVNLNIYSSNPASNTALAAGDYDSFGTTAYTDSGIDQGDLSTTGYNDFTFNSTGRGAIQKTGITKLGLRESYYDVAENQPNWFNNLQTSFYHYSADESGTSKDPKLVIVHTEGGGAVTETRKPARMQMLIY